MPFTFGEDVLENDDFKLHTDGNGDLVANHKQTGATFKYDSTKTAWVPVEGLNLEGADISNVGAVSTDKGFITSGITAEIVPHMYPAINSNTTQAGAEVEGTVVSDQNSSVGTTLYFNRQNEDVFIEDAEGFRNKGTFGGSNTLNGVWMNTRNRWIVFSGTGDTSTFKSYVDFSDLSSDTTRDTKSSVYRPLNHAISFMDGNTEYFMWGEYVNDSSGNTPNIYRYDFSNQTINSVQSISTARHIHHVQEDIYNDGHFYAFTGDGGDENQVWKSTDYGASWSQVASSEGKYRIVNVAFTKDYLYWAPDSNDSAASALWRAQRGSISSPTKIVDLPTELFSYGAARVFEPNGILISLLDPNTNNSEIPLPFYDLDNDVVHDLGPIQVDTSLNNRVGVRQITSHQNEATGAVSVSIEGRDNWADRSSVTAKIRLSKHATSEIN